MTDQKTEKKTTPESTRRFRLLLSALRNIEDAQDHEVHTAIGEAHTFMELYVSARLREVDARVPLLATQSHAGQVAGLAYQKAGGAPLESLATERASQK